MVSWVNPEKCFLSTIFWWNLQFLSMIFKKIHIFNTIFLLNLFYSVVNWQMKVIFLMQSCQNYQQFMWLIGKIHNSFKQPLERFAISFHDLTKLTTCFRDFLTKSNLQYFFFKNLFKFVIFLCSHLTFLKRSEKTNQHVQKYGI